MKEFEYRGGELYCENVALTEIAEKVGTPCFVYSRRALVEAYDDLDQAFSAVDHLICFAMKSNCNLAVLHLLAERGAGMDIVSQGELFRALRAGVPANRIVYSGVGKSDQEIGYAIANDILSFNVESLPELATIDRVAAAIGKTASVSLRINPDVESHTHEYTTTGKKETKFGIPYEQAVETYLRAGEYQNMRIVGIDTHIGSQITRIEPFVEAYRKIADLFRKLETEGFELEFVDIGGGMGIRYHDETPLDTRQFAEAVLPVLEPLGARVILEPGRLISGNAGVLLTRVIHFKETPVKNFAVVDAGMNDLLRPSLYGAWHEVQPLRESNVGTVKLDVVGPICESGDWLAKDRLLPKLDSGDFLCIFSAGAYGATMSSNYNGRPRAAEVLVEDSKWRVVRRAETFEDLVRGEEI
ncbi:MAG: diaminopimelate decarboxylase [Candidatus Glassbacteria bacterium]